MCLVSAGETRSSRGTTTGGSRTNSQSVTSGLVCILKGFAPRGADRKDWTVRSQSITLHSAYAGHDVDAAQKPAKRQWMNQFTGRQVAPM